MSSRPMPATPPLLYTIEQAADMLSVSRSTVFELLADGSLPAASLDEFVASLPQSLPTRHEGRS